MPSRVRPAASSRFTRRPAKRTSPRSEARSPEIRPNRLVLPALFGPTIPTMSPGWIASDRFSAMTTWPNFFDRPSSSSSDPGPEEPSHGSGLVIQSLVRRQQVGGDLRLRQQGVVDDLHLDRILGALLPLDA